MDQIKKLLIAASQIFMNLSHLLGLETSEGVMLNNSLKARVK